MTSPGLTGVYPAWPVSPASSAALLCNLSNRGLGLNGFDSPAGQHLLSAYQTPTAGTNLLPASFSPAQTTVSLALRSHANEAPNTGKLLHQPNNLATSASDHLPTSGLHFFSTDTTDLQNGLHPSRAHAFGPEHQQARASGSLFECAFHNLDVSDALISHSH
ncbi:unnamed protein product [Protopolystoma xenopodis]|uniref:Uncharacterized protein n=1 Tax=Protopolystoma xenopodis TaxID=117903 RepID=A0A3S5BBC6_9PLAT|nr:unnamed protein product [Protopolystoma xenopodis]